MALFITVAAIFVLLCLSETLWRHRDFDPEYARKFVHISVGSFVAFWPLFLRWNTIVLLSGAFVVAILVSKYLNIFQAIHSVQRPTWGEVFFGLAVGILAYVTHDGWIYCAALLHMSLADGLAAVVGTKFGRSNSYTVFGNPKSLAGTLTFLVVSVIIFAVLIFATPLYLSPWLILIIFGAAVLENLSIQGVDNLLLPLWVAAALRFLG
jgi:phytol kinase